MIKHITKLKVGDVIRISGDNVRPYTSTTVVRVDETFVHFRRPYVHVSDIGISYIGVEDWTMPLCGNYEWEVIA